MESLWRLAVMFDAPGGELAAMGAALAAAEGALRACAAGAHVRVGVIDQHPDLAAAVGDYDLQSWRTVDAAVEVTVPQARAGGLRDIAKALAAILQPIAAPGSAEVMAGPMYPMVPQRDGECFLSLAFRRDLRITRREFRDWWRLQHSQIAIPVLGPGLLAYDQVHLGRPGELSGLDRQPRRNGADRGRRGRTHRQRDPAARDHAAPAVSGAPQPAVPREP
jgi:hypothetical protein